MIYKPLLLGQVNYTGYLHITIAKVATPNTVAWETWIALPFTNYALVIPVPDADNYNINFYNSTDNSSLGTFISGGFFEAMTTEYQTEIRFYQFDNLPAGATLDVTAKILNDPYLVGKTIEWYDKEGFRLLEPGADINFDNTTGDIALLTGTTFDSLEKFVIGIKYQTGTITASGGGIYTGMIDVSAATATLSPSDRNKLVRLVGSASTQVITLPPLSSLSVDDGYYFDNSVGGTAKQVKILMDGGDRIRYDGFMESTNEYAEFWVSKGQHLLIKKYDDNYAEIRSDFKGTCVGEKVTVGFKDHPLIIAENNQLMDGDEWPLFWYWLTNILPASHKYTTDTVTDTGFTHTATKPGQFAVHSTLKKFRMPKTTGLVEKGLADFETYGNDTANRAVDYPGGYQAEMMLKHGHKVKTGGSGYPADPGRALVRMNLQGDPYQVGASAAGPYIEETGGIQQRVNNVGVIFARRMG